VIAKSLRLALVGIAFGTIALFAVAKGDCFTAVRHAANGPSDLRLHTFLLATVALVAASIPARRASHLSHGVQDKFCQAAQCDHAKPHVSRRTVGAVPSN
jgi:hypothetical protein